MRLAILLLSVLFISACAGRPDLGDPKLSPKEFNLEEFFGGHVIGYGQFQDRFGTVRRRFKVDVEGVWDGKVLTLNEDFAYADGSRETRVWTLTRTGPETWEGSAPGVIGRAAGEERGDTFNWRYAIDLPVPDGTLRVAFDDWMWLQTENRVLNRAYMDKYGLEIGEVIIWFEKQP